MGAPGDQQSRVMSRIDQFYDSHTRRPPERRAADVIGFGPRASSLSVYLVEPPAGTNTSRPDCSFDTTERGDEPWRSANRAEMTLVGLSGDDGRQDPHLRQFRMRDHRARADLPLMKFTLGRALPRTFRVSMCLRLRSRELDEPSLTQKV